MRSVLYITIPVIILMSFLIFFLSFKTASNQWAQLPDAFVAWGTMILAYATFILIWNSNKQNTRLIELEFKKRRINSVRDWISEICSIVSGSVPPGDKEEIRERVRRVNKVIFTADSIKSEAVKLENTVNELSVIIKEHQKFPEGLLTAT